jgi:hypothetical protein
MTSPSRFDRALAFVGTSFACLPILATLALSLIGSIRDRAFRFDFLMPAELFLFFVVGATLLAVVAFRTGHQRIVIATGSVSAAATLVSAQGIAVRTGLASGAEPAAGWPLLLVVVLLIAYVASVVVTAIGGIGLVRDLAEPDPTAAA